MKRKSLQLACLTAVVAACFAGSATVAVAQEKPAQEPSPMQKMMDDFRKRADERMQVLLEVNEQEYAVLKPRIEKVQRMQMASDSRIMGAGLMMSSAMTRPAQGQPQGQGGQAQPRENMMNIFMNYMGIQENPAVQRAKAMQAALESNEATTETLRSRLAELREAKKQVREEMTRAQEELRELCTVRQETVLVLMGLLE